MNKRKSIIGIISVLIIILIAAVSIAMSGFFRSLSLQQLKVILEGMGSMASVIFVMLCILRGVIFVPCGLISALGGMLFGRLMGTVLTLSGLTAGSVITFYLSRLLGRGWVRRIMSSRYQSYESYITEDSFSKIFLMRVLPILPFDAVSCISGLSGARLDRYIIATLLGSLPGVFIYVSFGDSIKSLSLKRMIFSSALILLFLFLHILYKYYMKSMRKTV